MFLIRILFISFLSFLLFFTWQTDELTAEAAGAVKVAVDTANIRSEPSKTSAVIDQASRSEQLQTVQEKYGWYEVKLANGQTGWIAGYITRPAGGASPTANGTHTSTKATGTVTADQLRVRTAPSLSASIIGKLHTGDQVTILGTENGWVNITHNGSNAWVSGQYIQRKEAAPARQTKSKADTAWGTFAVITIDGTNLRSGASTSSPIIVEGSKGERYPILGQEGDWYKIQLASGSPAYVASWVVSKDGESQAKQPASQPKAATNESVSIITNGTNLRAGASTSSPVLAEGSKGESYPIVAQEGDWYKIQLPSGSHAYVASWVVSKGGEAQAVKAKKTPNAAGVQGKTIVIDPGHGGYDPGATSGEGAPEKTLALQTAQRVSQKLSNAGANVIMTRSNDTYISLAERVQAAERQGADAFISVHYDSATNSSANGFTTYYYHDYQSPLAQNVHRSLDEKLSLADRGTRQGDYYVIRENSQSAILLELGFLSNPEERAHVSTSQYQELVADGVYNGLVSYFN